MENININIKAAFIAALILLITYWYYAGKSGSFVTGSAALIFGAVCIAAWIGTTLLVKLVNYAMVKEWIYPTLLFRVLLPFLLMALIFWLVYGIIRIPRFAHLADFMLPLKVFASKHLLYCALCALVMGVILSLGLPQSTAKNTLLMANVKLMIAITGTFVASLFLFYFSKKIADSALPVAYANYPNLDAQPHTSNQVIKPLLNASEYHLLDQPYLLPDKNELIINLVYISNHKKPPLFKSFKLNSAGEIIDSLTAADQSYFENGYIRNLENPNLITWAFDGKPQPQLPAEFKAASNWQSALLSPDTTALRMVYFQKTSAFNCTNLPEVKWNGSRYYELHQQNDTLKFKLDEVYLKTTANGQCGEQTVEYFTGKGIDFALIRLNEKSYYIVQSKK